MLKKYNSRKGYPDMLGRATSGYEMQTITATTTTTITTTTITTTTTTTTILLISERRISFKFLSVIHI